MIVGGCPKEMTFGPCGGVRSDETCEVDARPCPFLGPSSTPWPAPRLAIVGPVHARGLPVAWPTPVTIVDVRVPSTWSGDERRLWHRIASGLGGCVALIGEHVDNSRRDDDAGPVDAAVAVEILASHEVPAIVTITGRDRDLEAARGQMVRLAAAGATAVHCVTGDHPAALGIDRSAWFGAEAVTLARLAADLGLVATVGESPASPGRRAERVAIKAAAGATACVLNHAGDVAELVAFADECRQLGTAIAMVAPIPMVGDLDALAGLAQFPGLRVPDRFVEIMAGSSDHVQTAVDTAALMAAELVASGRFVGVNLSGGAAGTDPVVRIETTRRFIDAIHAEYDGQRP